MRVAAKRIDIEDAILNQRRIPCICEHQFDEKQTPRGIATARSRRGDLTIERVQCDIGACGRSWRRIIVNEHGKEEE